MWCPRCEKQYDDEFTTCLICGGDLEEYQSILAQDDGQILDLEEAQPEDAPKQAPPEELMPELVVSVAGEEEARRLAALLEGLKIPCLCCKAEDLPQEDALFEEWEETDEAFSDEDFPEEEESFPEGEDIYDLLVPQMMLRKALRILQEEEALQAEREAAAKAKEEAAKQADQPAQSAPKARKSLFGFFGKKQK